MAENTKPSVNRSKPTDVMIASLWRRWQALEASRRDGRMGAAGAGLDHKLCALALTIASIPASTWGDLMPKVMIAAFLREDPGSAPSYQAPMLEVAIARDTARLQSHSDGPSLH